MLENRPQVDMAVSAMKAGAADVVTKPIDNENLVRIVRDALRQDIHVSAVAAGRRAVEVRGFAQLTRREREVLQLITNGQSNKEAGRELGISPRTIEVHRARIMHLVAVGHRAVFFREVADRRRIVQQTGRARAWHLAAYHRSASRSHHGWVAMPGAVTVLIHCYASSLLRFIGEAAQDRSAD